MDSTDNRQDHLQPPYEAGEAKPQPLHDFGSPLEEPGLSPSSEHTDHVKLGDATPGCYRATFQIGRAHV